MIKVLPQHVKQVAASTVWTGDTLTKLTDAINQAAERYGMNKTARRMRYYLAQTSYETGGFRSFIENLNYSDPARIAALFKSGFDLNKNGVVDAAEIEFAKAYVRSPEKLANRAYANRYGNGNEASGDGWRYRGRGPIQLTFLNNYKARSQSIYGDDRLVRNPDLVLDVYTGQLVAGCFWAENGLNELADSDSFTKVTTKIHGSAETVSKRLDVLREANKIVF